MTKNEAILELISVIRNLDVCMTSGEHEYISILMHEAEELTKEGKKDASIDLEGIAF